jgi:hypothetical protein
VCKKGEWDDLLNFIILPLGRIPRYAYASLKRLQKTQWENMIGERVHSTCYLYCIVVTLKPKHEKLQGKLTKGKRVQLRADVQDNFVNLWDNVKVVLPLICAHLSFSC